MEHEYSWEQSGSYTTQQGDGFGWAVLVAVVLALVIHVGFFIWMSGTLVTVDITKTEEWVSEPVRLEAVDTEVEPIAEAPPEEEIARPEDDGELIESIEDALPELSETEIDISPLVEEALPDLKFEKPVLAGSDEGDLLRPTIGPSVATKTPEPGQIDDLFPEAKAGQVVVDKGKPLSDVFDPDSLAKELGQKKGAGGKSETGVIRGYTGLAAYAKMAPGDLQRNKASIGSDLLFAFNKSTLRDDARLTLMTVAMLIDRNPDMYCWVEGHTDLIGGDASNRELSRRRGEAVKSWLVKALKISPQRIIVRAFGKDQPVVMEGSIEDQAPNRRVDIKMRKAKPEPVRPKPARAEVIEEDIPKAEPVDEDPPVEEFLPEPEIPRALPVEEVIPE